MFSLLSKLQYFDKQIVHIVPFHVKMYHVFYVISVFIKLQISMANRKYFYLVMYVTKESIFCFSFPLLSSSSSLSGPIHYEGNKEL